MIWQKWEERLRSVSSDARRELCYLAEFVFGIPVDGFFVRFFTGDLPFPTEEQEKKMDQMISRRCSGEPIQYLLGKADFYGRSFVVSPGVLIPRFDTEILVQEALKVLKDGDRVLDLCAGSGCVGLTLGAEKAVSVTAVEKFDEAFSVLRKNRDAFCPQAVLIRADVLTDPLDGVYELIVSNPPYIPTDDIAGLSPEVRKEPMTALDGGKDGLDFYRVLVQKCVPLLTSGGRLMLECGVGQAKKIEALFSDAGFDDVRTVLDYGGVPRVVCGVLP